MRKLAAAGIAVLALISWTLTSCQREKRELRAAPVRRAIYGDAARQSELQPGGPQTEPQVTNPDHANAWSISEGQRLFEWYNCVGCHSHGGGGIGPPLIKKHWIYGGQPANLFDTIVKGRPNGMPAWGGRIPEYQVWQIVAYVRSLAGEQPFAATPVRTDELEQKPTTIHNKVQGETR
ncbi:MAG: c-type cytochrome [Acidobacteriia bacterium]|nr:c-type cytochrome [Terriglobia bacterium]